MQAVMSVAAVSLKPWRYTPPTPCSPTSPPFVRTTNPIDDERDRHGWEHTPWHAAQRAAWEPGEMSAN